MANASMKWNDHITDILKGIEGNKQTMQKFEDESELQEQAENQEEDDE
jgi:hypothetical protein